MSRTDNLDETIRKRSGWLIPLGVFLVTFVLSAIFLLFYLAPRPPVLFEEQVAPTPRTDLVALKVHDLMLYIPANYLEYRTTRQGGERSDIALFALLPDMRGWSNRTAQIFADNTANSPVIYILVREERLRMTEADRLNRIYMAYVANPKGEVGPFGLTQYTFRDDSGYRREDLFVGVTSRGPVVLRCVRFSQQVPSPSCLRDMQIAHGVALSYRFKRAYLARWREISGGVDQLIQSFEKKPS